MIDNFGTYTHKLQWNREEELNKNYCSYYYDGVDKYATLGTHINSYIEGAATFSVRFVLRLTDLTATRWIFANGNSNTSFRVQWFQPSQQLRVWFSADGTTTSTIEFDVYLMDTNWHEVIITYNNGTVTLYQDGASSTYTVITGSIPSTLVATGVPFKLGNNAFSGYFKGYINQILFTNDIITSGEASTLWNGGSPVIGGSGLSNVVASYLFDYDTFNGTDWTLIDQTGGGNGISFNMDAIDRDSNENPY